MKLVLLLLLSVTLYASKSCYTVQIMSAYNSPSNKEDLQSKRYDNSCKVMEIGKNLTVRCGCFDKYSQALQSLPKFVQEYPKAYVMSTYRSRFEEKKKEGNEEKNVVAPVKTPPVVAATAVTPAPVSAAVTPTLVSTNSTTSTVEKQKVEVIEVVEPVVQESKEVETPKELVVVQEKTEEISKPKKKKKKVKKKRGVKYVKKRTASSKYDRYLKKLESRKPNRKYAGYEYKFGAQISYDFAYIYEADEKYYAHDYRRVRVYHQGSFYEKKLFYELEYSFTGNNHYKDNYVAYKDKLRNLDLNYRVKMGNIKIPFSLETYSSSKNITFMERALNDAFSDNRKIGAEVLLSQKIDNSHINLFGALYSSSIDERIDNEIFKRGYTLRATYAYKFSKRHLLSIGTAYQYKDMNGDDIKIDQGAESDYVNNKYLSIKIKDVDTTSKNNIELFYMNEKYAFQAEYTRFRVNAYNKREYLQEYNFDAYYLEGSYFFIGKGKKYKLSNSTLGKVKPKVGGAVEFALRYSYINLTDTSNDKEEIGGYESDYVAGVNWYVNKELKFMFNYVVAQPKKTEDYDGMLQIWQARALFAF